MKVANVIIAHKNPDQVFRLVNQFDINQFHNFLHIDGRNNINDYRKVLNHPGVTPVFKRRKLVWAGYGFVAVTLDTLKLIRDTSREKYFYTNLISGMDFPIKPTSNLYEFLIKNYEGQRQEFFEILDLSIWPGAHRFERYHLIEVTTKGRYFAERIINNVIPKRTFYGGKLKPYGRSAWFTASIDFIKYVLNYCDTHPDFLKFLRTTWSPDEFIFNTLIMNSSFKDNIAPHFLRHIDWSEGKVSPKIFKSGDFNELINSQSFFARKFDTSIDSLILDQLEKSISSKYN
jgi:hypothetical protein